MLTFLHHRSMSVMPSQLLMLLHQHGLGPVTWSRWHKMPLCWPSWTCPAFYRGTDLYLYRSDWGCHIQFICLSHTLVYVEWLTAQFAPFKLCSYLQANVTSWWSFCHQELHTKCSHHRSALLWSSFSCMLKVPLWHLNMIWGILPWPPSSMPYWIY